MAGLPKKYAKMGFKKGWKAYKASKSGSKTQKTNRRKSNVAKAKNGHKKKSLRQKVNEAKSAAMGAVDAATDIVAAFGIPTASAVTKYVSGAPPLEVIDEWTKHYTGFSFQPGADNSLASVGLRLFRGYGPYGMKKGVQKLLSYAGARWK